MAAPVKAGDVMAEAAAYYRYLHQGRLWIPKDGVPRRIVDMDPAWRHNAAAWLLRRAPGLTLQYLLGEYVAIYGATAHEVVGIDNGEPVYGRMISLAPDPDSIAATALEYELERAADARDADPEAWMRSMPLYRALVAGLPAHGGEPQ